MHFRSEIGSMPRVTPQPFDIALQDWSPWRTKEWWKKGSTTISKDVTIEISKFPWCCIEDIESVIYGDENRSDNRAETVVPDLIPIATSPVAPSMPDEAPGDDYFVIHRGFVVVHHRQPRRDLYLPSDEWAKQLLPTRVSFGMYVDRRKNVQGC